MSKDGSGGDKTIGRNSQADLQGKKRSNAIYFGGIGQQPRLYKKSEFADAKLRHITRALMGIRMS